MESVERNIQDRPSLIKASEAERETEAEGEGRVITGKSIDWGEDFGLTAGVSLWMGEVSCGYSFLEKC